MIALIALAMLGPLAGLPETGGDTCGLPKVVYSGELYNVLALRAADAVDRSGQAAWNTDAKLSEFVAPAAEFGLGTGDVGRPLANGRAGLRAMALMMRVDQFRYHALSGIPSPAQPCGEQAVDVEFINTQSRDSFTVRFTFRAGKIVKGEGWAGAFNLGPIRPVQP